LFGNDSTTTASYDTNAVKGNFFWDFGSADAFSQGGRNAVNIAAISVFDRVLSDGEIREVFNYYTGSLQLDIGL